VIRVVVTPAKGVDLLDVIGVPIAGDLILPFATWPIEDGPIEVPGVVQIPRWAPPPPPKPTFTKAPAKTPGLRDVGVPPAVADLGAPLAPEAFYTWLVAQLPDLGPVASVDMASPAFQAVVTAARKGLAKAPANLGVNADAGWALLAHDLEHVVRRCALPADAALVILRRPGAPDDELRDLIVEAAARGISRPGSLAEEIIAEAEAEAAALAAMKERDAAALRHATEQIEVDLSAAGLAEFTTDEKTPFGARRIFRSGALPIGDVTAPIPFLEGGDLRVALARIRSTGVATMTRAERDQSPYLPDELATALRQVRRREGGARRYSAADFTGGDARTVQGRAALLAFGAHASALVQAVAASSTQRTALAAYTSELLLTLVVAYAPEVSLVNAVAAIQDALRSYVATRTTTVMGIHRRSAAAPSGTWPSYLIAPDAIPKAVPAALGQGSPWRFGEALRAPTAAEERAIKLQIDPGAFERAVGEAVGDAVEIRSIDVYTALHAANLVSSATPAPAERTRVRAVLEAMGFTGVVGTDDEGRQRRVWRRVAA
jgi:hypothetical protein